MCTADKIQADTGNDLRTGLSCGACLHGGLKPIYPIP